LILHSNTSYAQNSVTDRAMSWLQLTSHQGVPELNSIWTLEMSFPVFQRAGFLPEIYCKCRLKINTDITSFKKKY
jgi:hypothetical protein